MARMLLSYPVYQFPLVYPGVGSEFGVCDVQIILEGLPQKTVVITQREDHDGTSTTNAIEQICTIISRTYLAPLHLHPLAMRFVERYEDTWSEVKFDGYAGGALYGGLFYHADPVELDWESLKPDVAYKEHRILTDPHIIQEEDMKFYPDECHRMYCGICSLDDAAPKDDGQGENSYGYCRNLAVYAVVWDYLVKKHGKDALKMDVTSKLTAEVRKNVSTKYGVVNGREIEEAMRLFGARGNSAIDGVRNEDGSIGLTDGRHRTCIARRLGVTIGVAVTEKCEVE